MTAANRPRYVSHYAGERKQDWTTPRSLFDPLHAEFAFTKDGASSAENALLPRFHVKEDVLVSWAGERVFCNPPWSRIPEFVELAGFADLAVLLVPARTNARWFHRALELGAEVRFFLGRPRFGDGKGSSPIDCVLLIFGNAQVEDLFDTIYNALGWIEPGRGNGDYEDARKALARLRELVKP